MVVVLLWGRRDGVGKERRRYGGVVVVGHLHVAAVAAGERLGTGHFRDSLGLEAGPLGDGPLLYGRRRSELLGSAARLPPRR